MVSLFLVAIAGVLSHPGLVAAVTGQLLPIYAAAAPFGVLALAYMAIVRPALARQASMADGVVVERDGARAREAQLKNELEVSELALGMAERAQIEAETTAAAKAQYLAAISREVRTPLTGVIGISDLLAETNLDGEQAAMTDTLRQSAEELQATLSGVLDFSSLETGELKLDDAPFDIREAAERAVMGEVPAARKKGIEIVFDSPPGLLTQARGDARRVEQMIAALVSNAVKYTERGEVVVALRAVDRPSGAEMAVSVKDSGIGVSHEDAKRIFEPFVRGEVAKSRRYAGTGLGLAVASKLAGLMQGRIELASEPGEGSTFTLRFAHRLRPTARGDDGASRDMQGQRILIVEDCAPAAEVLARQLKSWGARVETVVSLEEGEDALWDSLANGPEFTAMFLDVSLGGIDGLALASLIASKLENLPVVMMSPQDPRGAKSACADGVGVAVLEKPYRQEDLAKVLVRVAEAQSDARVDASDADAKVKAQRAPSRPNGPILQPGCIVLADDNATNRTLIEKFLADEEMTLIHAPDGIGAVEAFSDWAPDLILMDVSMPRMDGLEATRKIREAERAQGLSRVPIIALTARAMANDRSKCLEAGMDDYVTKPIRKSELKAKITEWTAVQRKTA